jgi:hypothetical protein
MRDCHAQLIFTVESTAVCCPCLVFAFVKPFVISTGRFRDGTSDGSRDDSLDGFAGGLSSDWLLKVSRQFFVQSPSF